MKGLLKKSLALLLTLTMVFGAAPLAGLVGLELPKFNLFCTKAEAAIYNGTCGKNLTWSLNTDTGVLTISGTGDMSDWKDYYYFIPWNNYRSSIKTVVIGNSVTSIGGSAFEGCKALTSVTIPDSVTSIGDNAFSHCDKLTSVTIGNGVTSIGDYAFYECIELTSITIPDNVTSIGKLAFSHCTGLTSISIGDGVTSIGWGILSNCTGLTNIAVDKSNQYYSSDDYGVLFNKDKTVLIQYTTGNGRVEYVIPDGTTSIGEDAFSYCTGLTSIKIPDSVTSIGARAFEVCTKLTSITIPDNIISIGSWAFEATGFRYDSSNWENGVLYIGNHLIDTDSDLSSSYSIRPGTKTIADCAFYDTGKLTSITIPDSVRNIGNSAFYECKRLTSVTMGNGVTNIGEEAFYNCDGLTSITIPDSVTSIGHHAFENCDRLTSITIPDSVTSIGWSAFFNTGLYENSSNWENGVLYIGNHLINAKTTISGDYTIKAETKTIANSAFRHCSGLTSVTIPDSVTSIGDSAFSECQNLQSVNIPDSVTRIDDDTFFHCTKLTKIIIPNSVTSIGDYAFYACKGLTSITIPNRVTSIGERAFCACETLTSVTIPYSVTNIGDWAFCGCYGLKSVTIGKGVKTIGNNVFYICTGLTNITVDKSNQYYSSDDYGVLFDKDKTVLVQYPIGNGRAEYVVPNSVTDIGEHAFCGCTGLTSVTIPDSVTNISSGAFSECIGLTSVTFGEKSRLLSIEGYAFYKCTGLQYVHIPVSVTTIGRNILSETTAYICCSSQNCYAKTYADISGYEFRLCKGHISIIKQPTQTTIKYGDAIILNINTLKLPEGSYVEWTADNGNFSVSTSADGTTCKISPKSSGTTVFTATAYDKYGDLIGSDTQEMTAKAGFFDKIAAFFKKIFGLTKTIPEAFKGIF